MIFHAEVKVNSWWNWPRKFWKKQEEAYSNHCDVFYSVCLKTILSLWVTFYAFLNHNPSLSLSDLPFHPLSSKKKLHLIKSKLVPSLQATLWGEVAEERLFLLPTHAVQCWQWCWGTTEDQQHWHHSKGGFCTAQQQELQAAGATSNVPRMQVRTRRPDKTSGKETQLQGKTVTNCGQWDTLLQILGLKTRQRLLRLPQCCASRLGECREQSLYVIYPLHTELRRGPGCPVSTEDLSAAEWEHCASAAAVRNRGSSQQPSATALSWQGELQLLTPLVASRPFYLHPPLAGRAFHRGLCCRRHGWKRLLNGKEARSHQQTKSKQGRALATWP